jgi:hypothetical protein
MRKILFSFLSVYEEFTFSILTQKLKAKILWQKYYDLHFRAGDGGA